MTVEEKNKIIKDNLDIINAVRHSDSFDLKSIADRVDLSWPTVKSTIDTLIASGVIVDDKTNTNKRFLIQEGFGYFLGIAIGATETKCAITNFNFEPINKSKNDEELVSNFKSRLERVLGKSCTDDTLCFRTINDNIELRNLCSYIIECALDVFGNYDGKDLLSIGISFPAIIDKNNGEISFCINIPQFIAMPLSCIIRSDLIERMKKAHIVYHFCHDTVAATVFEKEWLYYQNNLERLEKDKGNVATVYMGYGIGCGLIMNHTLMLGASGAIGEIGHIPIEYEELKVASGLTDEIYDAEKRDRDRYVWKKDENASVEEELNVNATIGRCSCGHDNCLERLIRIKVFNSIEIDDFIRKTHVNKMTCFPKEHPYRYRVLKHFIAKTLCMIINILNVDLIILSGRLLNNIPQLKKDVEGLISKYSLTASAKCCKVIFGSGQADTVAIGASIMSYYNIKTYPCENVNIVW